MNAAPPRPSAWRRAALLAGLSVLAVLALDWDLAALTTATGRGQAIDRLGSFLAAFGAPDLGGETLGRALELGAETLAMALLGTALGAAIGYLLAIGASRNLVHGEAPPRLPGRVLVATSRLLLDVLRGVPDFAWALLILTVPGPGPVTAVLALAVHIGGILGKIYSELWDALEPARYRAPRAAGAGRLAVLLYGIQPLAARGMLSYTLMRAECAIRNASVIGVVSGGGIGSAVFEELGFGNDRTAVTLLLCTLALTGGADLLANLFRYQLRTDPNHPRAPIDTSLPASRRKRRVALGGLAAALVVSVLLLLDGFRTAFQQIQRPDGWEFAGRWFGLILQPDLSAATVAEAAGQAVVPLALGVLATLASIALAGLLCYPASYAFQVEPHRFTGEAPRAAIRSARAATLLAARGTGLLLRGIPEVAWLLILAALLRMGTLAGLLAMTAHSTGVLLRVFAETVDNLPYRRLEVVRGSRAASFLYGALPLAWTDWRTYGFFQFEVNVRAGVVLGIVGVGGLGDVFHTSLSNFNEVSLPRAGTFLLAMVLLTALIDRLSRAIGVRGVRCRPPGARLSPRRSRRSP